MAVPRCAVLARTLLLLWQEDTMNRLLLVTLALPLMPASAQPDCLENRDCGIGNVCSSDGLCSMSSEAMTSSARAGLGGGEAGQDLGSSGAAFDGHIGRTTNRGPAQFVWDGPSSVRVVLEGQPNTFLAVNFADPEALNEPGVIVVADPNEAQTLEGAWSAACNHDVGDYDEILRNVVVEVAEASPAGIVSLVIRTNDEGTAGVATVPWTPLAL